MRRRAVLAGIATLPLVGCATTVGAGAEVASADLTLVAAEGRAVPVRLTWPRGATGSLPLLLLSHGANGTLDGLGELQRGLTRGRAVAAAQHLDSEANPNRGAVPPDRLVPTRVADMRLLADSVAALERASGVSLDRRRLFAGGHSFGALIAQALGGARIAGGAADPRIRAVVAFSPPGPIAPLVAREGWAAMTVPQFVQTGTADVLPRIAPAWEAHTASYEESRVAGSLLWVGRGVDHYFGNLIQRRDRVAPDQRAAFAAALAIADAFLAAQAGDARARRWLAGGGARRDHEAVTERFEAR